MNAMLWTVFLASLAGSGHCAGMCGGFVALYAGSDANGRLRRGASPHIAYHAGRWLVYATLGASAGAIGSAVNLAGRLAGLQRVAMVAAGLGVLLWGLVLLARAFGAHLPAAPVPTALVKLFGHIARAFQQQPPLLRAAALGLASGLLPCGWLYAFVVTAAGTADPVQGALAMSAFWLGTVPLLAGLGLGVQRLAGPLQRHLPKLSAVALVLVGWVAVTRHAAAPLAGSQRAQGGICCHDP